MTAHTDRPPGRRASQAARPGDRRGEAARRSPRHALRSSASIGRHARSDDPGHGAQSARARCGPPPQRYPSMQAPTGAAMTLPSEGWPGSAPRRRTPKPPWIQTIRGWARLGSNQRPLACEALVQSRLWRPKCLQIVWFWRRSAGPRFRPICGDFGSVWHLGPPRGAIETGCGRVTRAGEQGA